VLLNARAPRRCATTSRIATLRFGLQRARVSSAEKSLCGAALTLFENLPHALPGAAREEWHSPCEHRRVVGHRRCSGIQRIKQPTLQIPSLRFMQFVVALLAIAGLALVRFAWPQLVD
jgi:hypothetical protein